MNTYKFITGIEFEKDCKTETCKADIDIPSEHYKSTIEIKFTRNPGTESNQTMLFFNEQGNQLIYVEL